MITNDKGQVALVYFQPIPKMIELKGKQFYFGCKNGVSMCWVDPQDVPALFALKGGCCGAQQQIIHEASPSAVSVHMTNTRDGYFTGNKESGT